METECKVGLGCTLWFRAWGGFTEAVCTYSDLKIHPHRSTVWTCGNVPMKVHKLEEDLGFCIRETGTGEGWVLVHRAPSSLLPWLYCSSPHPGTRDSHRSLLGSSGCVCRRTISRAECPPACPPPLLCWEPRSAVEGCVG